MNTPFECCALFVRALCFYSPTLPQRRSLLICTGTPSVCLSAPAAASLTLNARKWFLTACHSPSSYYSLSIYQDAFPDSVTAQLMYLPHSIPLWEMRCRHFLSSFPSVFLFKINLAFGNYSSLSSPLLVPLLWSWKVDTMRQEKTNSTQLRTLPNK